MSCLESTVDQGLLFYWTLAVTASELSGGGRAVVELAGSRGGNRTARRSDDSPEADDRRESESPAPDVRVPDLRVTLQVDAEPPDRGTDCSEVGAFLRRVRPLVLREQSHRAVRDTHAKMRALESRAVHDLRALLQPLVLHVSNLRDEGSPSAEDLELLDDLTRSLVEWLEEDLRSGELVEDRRQRATSGAEGVDLRTALEEVLTTEDRGRRIAGLPERLPDLLIDRPSLDAGLRELLRTAGGGPWTLKVRRSGDSAVRIRADLEETPENPETSARSVPNDSEHPRVTGGLLSLTVRMGGRLRLEASSSAGRRIDVRLPGSSRGE